MEDDVYALEEASKRLEEATRKLRDRNDEDEGGGSKVREPRKPRPKGDSGAVAMEIEDEVSTAS